YRPDRDIAGIARDAAVTHLVEGRRRQVRRVGVHVPHKEEEGLAALGQALQLRDGDLVEVFRLGRLAGLVGHPAVVVEVVVKPPGAGVAAKADARRLIPGLPQNLGKGRYLVGEPSLVPERHHLRGKAVHARQHAGIPRRGGDVGRKEVFKQDAALCELVDVGRREAMVAVAAHVVRPQAVDGKHDDVDRPFGHGRSSLSVVQQRARPCAMAARYAMEPLGKGRGAGRTRAPPCSCDSMAAKVYSNVARASRAEPRSFSNGTWLVTSSKNACSLRGKVWLKSLTPVSTTRLGGSSPRPTLSGVQTVSFSMQFSMQSVPLVPPTSTLHHPPRPDGVSPRWLRRYPV